MRPVFYRLKHATRALVAGPRPFSHRPLAVLAFLAATTLVTGCAGTAVHSTATVLPASSATYAWQRVTPEHDVALVPDEARELSLFEDLGRWSSRPGETRDAFVVRVASSLSAWTLQTGFEACGYIGEGGAGEPSWSVHLSSNHSHFNCIDIDFGDSGKVTLTTETLHSHPNMGSFIVASEQDHAINPMNGNIQTGKKVPVYSRDFSDMDFERGPGFLVTHGHVLYQNTKAGRRDVGNVDRSVAVLSPDTIPLIAGIQDRLPALLASQRARVAEATTSPAKVKPSSVVSLP